MAGSRGESLVFLDNHLRHRKTYVEWCKTLMGPILDKLGVEQGGVNSDRLYKLANNAELRRNPSLEFTLALSMSQLSVRLMMLLW